MSLDVEKFQKAFDTTDAEMRAVSGKVSDVCRNVGIGSIAIFYALLLSEKDPGVAFYKDYHQSLTFLALAGAVTFALDYLQYLLISIHYRLRFDLLLSKANKKDFSMIDVNKNQTSLWNRSSTVVFWTKNISAAICCVILVYIIVNKVLS